MNHPLNAITKDMRRAIMSVIFERQRQDAKWGEQNHAFPIWLAILTEELGEMSQAYLKRTFAEVKAEGARREGKPVDTTSLSDRGRKLRKEMVEVAAVALAMIECCDRHGWDR